MRMLPIYGLPILTLLLIGFFSWLLPESFPTAINARSILSDKGIIALLALGAMVPMMAGRIDLTVGFGIVMWHILAISLQVRYGLPWPVACLAVLICSGGTGLINGLLVEVAQIDSFIATLGTGTILYALALWHTEGRQVIGTLPPGFVAINGTAAGIVSYADRTRDGLPAFFHDLRALGVTRTLLVSGDHEKNVNQVARSLGITEARGDMLPDQKVAVVRELLASGHRVLMTGDGTNDAPALSAATVGIALAAHGGGISAEAADIVLLADDVTRVTTAIRIGRRATAIARQSILAGLGLSAVAMVFAAFGFIPPTVGALLQEAIDVAVIVNALRSSTL